MQEYSQSAFNVQNSALQCLPYKKEPHKEKPRAHHLRIWSKIVKNGKSIKIKEQNS